MFGSIVGGALGGIGQGIDKGMDRAHEKEMQEREQKWRSGENAAERGWSTGEREGSQAWQTGRDREQRNWQSGENAMMRDWQHGERDFQNQWQSGENQASREGNIERDYLQSKFAQQTFAKNMELMGYTTPGAAYGGNAAGGNPTLQTSKGVQTDPSTNQISRGTQNNPFEQHTFDLDSKTWGPYGSSNTIPQSQNISSKSSGPSGNMTSSSTQTTRRDNGPLRFDELSSRTPTRASPTLSYGLGKQITNSFAGPSGQMPVKPAGHSTRASFSQ